jgi:PleD family two-component response regulator
MDILIIERDELTIKLLTSRLEEEGHTVTVETSKSEAVEALETKTYDIIMVDPSPLKEARPVVLGLFKAIRGRFSPYIFLLSKNISKKEAISSGANDLLSKPLKRQQLEEQLANAKRLLARCETLKTGKDFDSAGGMIGKSAFNELFLSSIDRSHRYGERSYVVFMKVENLNEIEKNHGKKKTEAFIEALTSKVVRMRRQSDVVGRADLDEYAVLLQRPLYETEPFDATTRFTELMSEFISDEENKALGVEVSLTLIEVPLGEKHMQEIVSSNSSIEAA